MGTIKFVKRSINATTPTRHSQFSAGYDLYSAYDYIVQPRERISVSTDISVAMPDNCYGRIAPRSGLSLKYSIDIGGGVIDQDYRGNIYIILINNGKEQFKINKGDRIAQLICQQIYYPKLEEVTILDNTVRGCNGFGSTGNN
nr:deoxyuridine 5'-triphosphate nucleotidohydrolase-like protein [Wadden Sea poxvirus]